MSWPCCLRSWKGSQPWADLARWWEGPKLPLRHHKPAHPLHELADPPTNGVKAEITSSKASCLLPRLHHHHHKLHMLRTMINCEILSWAPWARSASWVIDTGKPGNFFTADAYERRCVSHFFRPSIARNSPVLTKKCLAFSLHDVLGWFMFAYL
jgi:hypothetical protein